MEFSDTINPYQDYIIYKYENLNIINIKPELIDYMLSYYWYNFLNMT